jgi:Chaperone of endosialidase
MEYRDNNIFIAMLVALGFLALSPMAQTVVPAPDGGYPGGNTAEGQNALLSLTTGTYNTAVGIYSVLSLTDGDFCTGVGAGTLLSNTADENTATGAGALLSNTIGEANTANGAFALFSNTIGNSNTAIGAGTLLENIAASGNTAIGTLALANNDVVGVATAESNTAVGALALLNNIGGWENTAVGDSALASNQTGYANVAIGNSALYANVDGAYNTVVGFRAGRDVDGGGNIYIGDSVGGGILHENNTTRIGNHQQHCYIDGIYQEQPDPAANQPVMVAPNGHLVTPVSSARFKEDIKPMDNASEAILALQPVTFHYKNDANATRQFGLVAEEVARVNPDLVVPDGDGKPRSVRYEAVNAMLLNEFLKEHRRVEQLEAAMAKQKKSFEANLGKQQKQIEALASGLEKVNAQLATASPSTVALKISNQAPQVALNSQ